MFFLIDFFFVINRWYFHHNFGYLFFDFVPLCLTSESFLRANVCVFLLLNRFCILIDCLAYSIVFVVSPTFDAPPIPTKPVGRAKPPTSNYFSFSGTQSRVCLGLWSVWLLYLLLRSKMVCYGMVWSGLVWQDLTALLVKSVAKISISMR